MNDGPSGVQVADARRADAAALAEIAARTFPLACPPSLTSADIAAFIAANLSVERFRGYLADPQRAVLVAHCGTDPAGYAMLIRHTGGPAVAGARAEAPVAELSKMYVLPCWHSRGTAAALMATALDRARAWHAEIIWLGVNRANVRAQRFYAKHGFTVSGTRTFAVGTALEHDYVMSRRLDRPADR